MDGALLMTMSSSRDAEAKWQKFWSTGYSHTGYATPYGDHLYEEEAIRAAAMLERAAPVGSILSLGVGLGQVELAIVRRLSDRARPKAFVATDIVSDVLVRFRQAAAAHQATTSVSTVRCDAYKLPFDDDTFDVVLSFGRASVASYRGVAPEVARVLKPGGMVIMDFINHCSAYDVARNFKRMLYYSRRPPDSKYTHLGRFGIARFYGGCGLHLVDLRYVGAVPPLHRVPVLWHRRLERWWPMKKVFARVMVGAFVKRSA